MKVAVLSVRRSTMRPVRAYHFCSDQIRSELGTKYSVGPSQLNMSASASARSNSFPFLMACLFFICTKSQPGDSDFSQVLCDPLYHVLFPAEIP